MKTFATLVTLYLMTGAAMAQTPAQTPQDMASALQEACQNELTTYCKAVTPGEGRAFACLYAHSDKLSGQCELALYNASVELGHALSKLNYVGQACEADLTKHCSGVQAGQGRIADCLKSNRNRVTAGCQQALQDTGLAD